MTLVKGGSLLAAQSRVNAAVISGTMYMNSDDVHDKTARDYMESLLTNPQINALAIKGKAFRPIEGNTGIHAADTFVLSDQETTYIAVFNYSSSPVDRNVDLERAGILNEKVSS